MRALISLLFLISAGCSTPQKSFVANGKTVFTVSCNGTGRTMADCYQDASTKCDGNFEKFSEDGSNSVTSFSNGNIMPVIKRSLMYYCTN